MAHHKNLDVWKISIEIVTEIYDITNSFPKTEIYGITAQIRRSAVSIPANIAEGCARQSDKDTAKFLNIALGSVAEIETLLIIAENLGYLTNKNILVERLNTINKLIIGLIKHLKSKQSTYS